MKTIPLDPVFNNAKFSELPPGSQFFVIKAIYLLAQSHKMDCLPDSLRSYFHCSSSLWNKFNHVFKEIIKEVAPEICRIKLHKYTHSLKGRQKALEYREKRKKERLEGKLVDEVLHNPVPLMPQFSALATTLHRERQLVQLPKPQHRQNERPPMLKEKPKG